MSLNTLWLNKKIEAFKRKASLCLPEGPDHILMVWGDGPIKKWTAQLCEMNNGYGPTLIEIDMCLRVEVPPQTRVCSKCIDIATRRRELLKDKVVFTI